MNVKMGFGRSGIWRAAAGVAVAIAVVAPLVARVKLPNRYEELIDRRFLSSREQRLIHFFGECEPAGYGYLKRVLAVYSQLEPNSLKRPVIRYRDFNRKSEYLFEPTRFETDPSVMVGVGLTESDMQEVEIRHASRSPDGAWRFVVESNFDLLTRIEIELGATSRGDIRLRLYRRERDGVPWWTLTRSVEETPSTDTRRTLQFPATPPLREFRSSLVDPFLIRIDGDASVHRVTAYGIVVSVEGYRIVHREGACFTAVRGDTEQWAQAIRERGGFE